MLEMSQSFQGLALVYSEINEIPKALEAYKKAEVIAKEIAANYELEKIYKGLALEYVHANNYPDAYKYQSLLTAIKDTLYNAETDKKLARLQFNFEIQKKQTEIDLLKRDKSLKDLDLKRQTTVRNSLIAVLSLVILTLFILFRSYRIKARTNALLDAQKKELELAFTELKTMQTQLVQSEKIASLGKLQQAVLNERLRISRELHDEVGATLSGIAMYSHLTKEQIKNANITEVEKSLNIMQQSAGEMVNKS